MGFRTRLINFFFSENKVFTNYRQSKNVLPLLSHHQSKWSVDKYTRILCFLLIGFLIGNLFGTLLNTIRKYVAWDGIIIFFLLSFIEIVNYNVYHNKDRPFFGGVIHPQIIKQSYWKLFNYFKIGLMVGFFVDAFKVGS
ncbi:DUF565 domain-containing protein [bacterium]|nr:MAG: DUF565 domain-containing protein [bacterium]